jgi:putative thioredoxin
MSFVKDVAAQDFEAAVLARSHAVPVVVDFWAEWCAPCRMLGPTLEREVNALGGAVELAKVDVDQAQELAGAFQVQGIPAVKAFRGGAVVAEFTGARDAAFVKRWLKELAPSPQQLALEQAKTVEALTALLDDAEVGLAACVELATLHVKHGRADQAAPLLERVPQHHALHARAEALRQQVALSAAAQALGDEATLRARVAANDRDDDARYALGCLCAARGDDAQALEQLLEVVSNRKAKKDDARKAMLAVFERRGSSDALTQQFRRRLQSVL